MHLCQPLAIFDGGVGIDGAIEETQRRFDIALFIKGDETHPLIAVCRERRNIRGGKQRTAEKLDSKIGLIVEQRQPSLLIQYPAEIVVIRDGIDNTLVN